MSKEIYISSTPHETRLAIVENDALAEIYYERENNRERRPLSDAPAPSETEEVQDFVRDDFNTPAEFSADNTPSARTDEANVGEGAPGADGSRRWRGRRGRRRGRGPGQRDESAQPSSAQPISPSVDSSYDAPADTDYDDSFDIDGAAAPPRSETAP